MTRRRVRRAARIDWLPSTLRLAELVSGWEHGRGEYSDSRLAVVALMRRSGCRWSNAAAVQVARHDTDSAIVEEARQLLAEITKARAALFTDRRP